MSKPWLGLATLILIATWTSHADAAIAMSPNPIAITATVGSTGSGMGDLSDTALNRVDLVLDPACTGMFTITPNNNVNLNSPKTITVMFTAQARSVVTCDVNVLINGTATSLGMFQVRGTGIAPQLSAVTATPFNVGSVRVANAATQTLTRTIQFRNTGDAATTLSISGVSVTGANAADYTITSPVAFPVNLAANATMDVVVDFDPSAAGNRTANLVVTSDDPVMATETVVLNGTGTNAVIGVSNVDFMVVANGTTATSTITVSNTATANVGTLTVSSAAITQTSTWFSFAALNGCTAGATACTLTGITAPADKTVSVRCSPPAGATGTQTGTVTFTSDTDGGGDSLAALTCTAGRAEINVTSMALSFGNIVVGATSTAQTVMITNTGNASLTYSITEGGVNPGQFAVATGCVTNCTVLPLAMTPITVNFSPTTIGDKTAILRITSNDPDTSPLDISLTGTGVAPRSDLTPTSLAFANVEVGATSGSQMVTVTNGGTSPLTISNASLNVLAADYVVTAGTVGAQSTVLAVGQSAMWQIACRPTTFGARNGTFRIVSNSNAAAGTIQDVTMTCTGQQGLLVVIPTTINFGGVPAGETASLNVTLTNTGNVAVNNITATLSNANVGYSITAPTLPIASLGAGASVTVTVRFAPLAGTDGGPITITFSGGWGVVPRTATAVLGVNGDGLTVGYDVTPALVAFGDLRWDTQPTRTFCIVNTSQAALDITNLMVTPGVGTATGEIAIVELRRRPCGGTLGTLAPTPQTLTMGQTLEVIVRADPADRTGAMNATITVMSDLATNPSRTVTVTGNSTTALLTTTPGLTVDFGSVDLDTGPATQMVTITNTGVAALDLGGFARTANARFTTTLPAATALAAGASVTIPITYTPTMEHAPNQVEDFIITHTVSGVLNGPTMQMITVRGRGIDRHIALDAVPTIPDTFRNPGSAAPTIPINLTNSGQALLQISAVMVSNDDVWQLVDPNPVDVPGLGAHAFDVRFVPKVAGMAPEGVLVIMNNDNAMPMAMVRLNGIGLNRNVVMGDMVIDVGYTGIGIPITLPEALAVTSMDPTNPFTIAAIGLDDNSVFSIDSAPQGVVIEPSASLRFDVTFTPDAEGTFETRAALYLDEDETATSEVTLRGTAVFVDVSGGGGCSTGRDTGGALALLLGVLALRRRRELAALVLALAIFVPVTARAQGAELNLDLALFNPTPSTTGTSIQLQPATVGADGDWVTSATLSYATNPLVLKFAGSEHLSIKTRTTMELGAAYAFMGKYEAGLRMPLYNQSGEGQMVGVDSPSGTARGDLTAHGRAQLVAAADHQLIAGASLQLTLPTATDQEFAGVDYPTARVLGLLTIAPHAIRKRLSLTFNAGAVLRATSKLGNIEQGSGFAWGAGASFRVLDALWATGEVFGDVLPGGRKAGAMESASALTTGEFLLGVSYRAERRLAIGLAVGRGVIAGLGTPDVRGVFTLSFAPGTVKLPPIYPPPPPKIDGDEDGDGIRDSVDKCVDELEDMDLFDDDDGCPDLDNDEDTFIDSNDKCPLDAEDKDGFQDDDGCPELDNDGDGITDAHDRCPNTAEDKDAHLDMDGCPELDNDLDGVEDDSDKCPAAAETINGNRDDDGCPDKGDSMVVLTPSALEILDPIKFTGTKVSRASRNVLGQVGATLRARGEIIRVKIVVHVQPSGDDDRDQELSEARAQAVRDWIIDWGISSNRVSAQGMGGKKPLVAKTQRNSALINERVEVIILERK